MSTKEESKWIDNLMGRLSLDQKVGQLMVFGFAGPVINPHVVELIEKYHDGGLRLDSLPGRVACHQAHHHHGP